MNLKTKFLLTLTLSTLPLFAELKYFPKDKDTLITLADNESIKKVSLQHNKENQVKIER